MYFRTPPPMPPWPGLAGAEQAGQAPSALPMNGQQAIYLLALMGQLAQSAHQGQMLQQLMAAQQAQAQAQAQALAEEEQSQAQNPEVGQGQPQPGSGTQPPQAQPVQGAMPVYPVAPVEDPAIPFGTRGNRHYWFGPLPNSSRNRLIRGPILSAWSR